MQKINTNLNCTHDFDVVVITRQQMHVSQDIDATDTDNNTEQITTPKMVSNVFLNKIMCMIDWFFNDWKAWTNRQKHVLEMCGCLKQHHFNVVLIIFDNVINQFNLIFLRIQISWSRSQNDSW